LKDQDLLVRKLAAKALGDLGDARAVPGLVEALPDWECKDELGAALKKIGWKPTSDTEQVYFWICNAAGANLKTQWEKTRQVLLADLKSLNQRRIENAVYTFVSLGKDDIVPELISILYARGDKEMAEMYLNCGHDGLHQAAQLWASAHGFRLMPLSGAGGDGTSWGNRQWR